LKRGTDSDILAAYSYMTARCVAKLRPAWQRADLFGGD